MTRKEAIEFLKNNPAKYGHMLGFTKLTDLHNTWIRELLLGTGDLSLMAHRGSYKTTCVSIALALIIILLPNRRTLFLRKTETDIKEIMRQVQKILIDPHTQYFARTIYGVELSLTSETASETSTNLTTDKKGTAQLVGIGIGGSLTGKHFDYIFTDDIINVKDRTSRSEREATKLAYQELQNIRNRGGRIINTLTPWHPEDASSLMPNIKKYDCYSTGLMTKAEIKEVKEKMSPSLFAANYELRHIASEDVIFTDPQDGAKPALIQNGIMHLDSAFYGEDYTAWTVMKKVGDKYYTYGQIRRKSVDDCYDEIIADYKKFNCGKLYNETNADKGMVGKDLKKRGARVIMYHESMNKYMKIVTYLKAIWKDVVFVEGTGDDYIAQIADYFEDAEHDDAPDSAACLARILYKKADNTTYKPLWN